MSNNHKPIEHMSTISQEQAATILHDAAVAVYKDGVEPYNKAAEQVQSIIGMVDTLVGAGRQDEVDQVLRAAFPEYYAD